MAVLIVTAHPQSDSLTASIVDRLRDALPADAVHIADLHAEGFDPRFTEADRITYASGRDVPPDVAAEQSRIDEATDVVLVFPVYWWSFPALLKGWIDRVFVNGWAFDVDAEAGIRRNLGRLTLHMIPVAGDTEDVYERHGYRASFETQIAHGILDFCGMQRGATAFVFDSEGDAGPRDRGVAAAIEAVTRAISAA